MNEQFTAEIPVEQFDLSLIPADARSLGTSAFRDAVVDFFSRELKTVANWIQVVVDKAAIHVSWRPKGGGFDPVEHAIEYLKAGDYARGVQILRIVAKVRPNDVGLHYNLGMALSDLGNLDDAIIHLRRAAELQPYHGNTLVALGVAYYRKRDLTTARNVLERAMAVDSRNPYALRNFATVLLALGEPPERPIEFLRLATEILPDDQQSWIGLAKALELKDDIEEADKAYRRAVEINPHNEIAEIAKTARSKIAQTTMREAVGGGLRFDAVMYCVGALERREKLTPDEVKKIAFEIATVGMKGINPNDPAAKYTLRTLPGDFTGLQLLCYMHVMWQQVAPHMDIGFDLRREYQEACKLDELRRRKE